jgi:bacterioferritin-associated ferredoxin
MYVCVCNGVTDHDIRQAAEAGCRSVAELTMRTGCGASCGACLASAAEILDLARDEDAASASKGLPMLSQAA